MRSINILILFTVLTLMSSTGCENHNSDKFEVENNSEKSKNLVSKTEEFLFKKWRIEKMDLGHDPKEEKTEVYEKMVKDLKENTYLEFFEDHTYEAHFGSNHVESGKFEYRPDEFKIFLSPKGSDHVEEIILVEANHDKLVIMHMEEGREMHAYLVPSEE